MHMVRIRVVLSSKINSIRLRGLMHYFFFFVPRGRTDCEKGKRYEIVLNISDSSAKRRGGPTL